MAEIARERENVESRYSSELDALEKQKEKEKEWYTKVKAQLEAEADKIEAKNKELATQLKNDMVGSQKITFAQK